MKILVTDGNNRAALAITRSLGRKGHTIVVGNTHHPSLASSSKYCSERISYPCPVNNPGDFIQSITESIQEKNIDVILPVSDVTTIPICENKETLEQYCQIPFSDAQAINLAADKYALFLLAEKLGVATPKSIFLSDYSSLLTVNNSLPYPIVVKPGKSRIKTEKGWLFTSVKYAENEIELHKILKEEPSSAYPLLLQERIVGPGVGIFVCYNKGTPMAFFSHQRIREKPPSGGVSVLRKSIPVSPLAGDFSERLLSHLKWHGVAMVEFKLDQRDNIPKLMEINGRFWGSLQLAIDAGVDFPGLLIKTIDNESIPPLKEYAIDVKTRWLLGDLDSLIMVLFKNRKSLKLPSGHPGRIKYLFNFLQFFQKDTYLEVLRRDDLRPWIFELQQWCMHKK